MLKRRVRKWRWRRSGGRAGADAGDGAAEPASPDAAHASAAAGGVGRTPARGSRHARRDARHRPRRLTDIAATAGCSRGLPTYLFGSKEGLLLALADYLVERFRTRLFEPALEQRQGLPALLIWLRVYVHGLRGPELQVRAACVLLGEALGSEPAFLPAINRLHRNVRSMVEHYLREGIERGEVGRDIDPQAHAALLIGTLRGVSLLAVTDPDSLDLDALGAELVSATERSLRA